ncbi:hypothetical protein ACFVH4_19245 [Nocardia ignorata]|uniref:hypothetical protein n=1 Tax=Nocardia ignorata TaxID=145285 RepID=UPI003628D27E
MLAGRSDDSELAGPQLVSDPLRADPFEQGRDLTTSQAHQQQQQQQQTQRLIGD